jgi:hypothetical protein
MNRRRRLRWLFSLLAAGGLFAASSTYFILMPATLILAAESSSDDLATFSAFSDELVREGASVRLQIKTMPDTVAVRSAIEKGQVHLAIVRVDLGVPVEGRAVAKLRDNVVALIARGGTNINTPVDLAGHNIGLVGPDIDARQIAEIFNQYEFRAGAWRTVPLALERLAAALNSREIDAVAVAGPATGRAMAEAVNAVSEGGKDPVFISIELAEAFVQRHPLYETAEIVAGTFRGNPPQPAENVTTISFAHYLLAASRVSDQAVAVLTRRLFEARPALAQKFPTASLIAAPSTDKDAALPAHPGALAYFNDGEKTFFDRYGDWVYILAMAGSLVVSLGVGFTNYFGSARLRRRATARRLNNLLKRCASAPNADTLARIEAEADVIVAQAMIRVEAGTLPSDALSAFSISLDLIRRAVAERRATLKASTSASTSMRRSRKRGIAKSSAGE